MMTGGGEVRGGFSLRFDGSPDPLTRGIDAAHEFVDSHRYRVSSHRPHQGRLHGPKRMSVTHLTSKARSSLQIECLACSATRVVTGIGHAETGECPRCHYLGWTYSDDLDGSTRRLIMNGGLAAASAARRHLHALPRR
jgi:hypothetical protein